MKEPASVVAEPGAVGHVERADLGRRAHRRREPVDSDRRLSAPRTAGQEHGAGRSHHPVLLGRELQLQLLRATVDQLLPARLVDKQPVRDNVPADAARDLLASARGKSLRRQHQLDDAGLGIRRRDVLERGGGMRRRLGDLLRFQLLEVEELGFRRRVHPQRPAGYAVVGHEVPQHEVRPEGRRAVACGGVREGEEDPITGVLAGLEHGLRAAAQLLDSGAAAPLAGAEPVDETAEARTGVGREGAQRRVERRVDQHIEVRRCTHGAGLSVSGR